MTLKSARKGSAVLAAGAVALACGFGALVALPAWAQAATYDTHIYNGTVVGSDWGETAHVRTATLSGSTLKLGKGSVSKGGTWVWTAIPKGKTFKVSGTCKFYRSFKLNTKGTGFTCSKKISKNAFKVKLRKANRKIARGPYNSNHYRLLVKTKHGKAVKLAIAKNRG